MSKIVLHLYFDVNKYIVFYIKNERNERILSKTKILQKKIYNVLGSDKYERPYNQFLNE